MSLNIQIVEQTTANIEAQAIPIPSEELKGETSSKKLKDAGIDAKHLKALGFKGTAGECQALSRIHNGKSELVIAVGVGEREKVDFKTLYIAGEALAKAAQNFKSIESHLLSIIPEEDRTANGNKPLQAHVEGLLSGSYVYSALKSKHEPAELKKVLIVSAKNAASSKALQAGKEISEAVAFARDLINEPGGSMTPQKFSTRAQAMARKADLEIKVMNRAAIEKAKMGGLLGVSRGSTQAPRFIEMRYVPTGKPQGHLALVGKGVTFDSGGLSIKPASGMMTMKCDMSGAAAVVSAIYAIAKLKLKVKVSAFIPLTDNMLGGDATRPGDVLVAHNKKTIEVLNTDAEGRLILADALSIASKEKPDAILDLATLTGACVVALGEDVAGLMGNNDSWVKQISKAADEANEKVWELPLVEEYKSQLKSTVADLKNIGSNYGGSITAGLFLQEFVDEKIPWAHLDIAGPAFKESGSIIGGTGFGVKLMVDLAANFKKPAENSKK